MESGGVEQLRHELWETQVDRNRYRNACHGARKNLVRRSEELREALRDIENTQAELAAAHAELATLRGGAVESGNCGGVVCVNTADPAGLDDLALRNRFIQVGEMRNRLDGLFCEILGELAARNGREAAAWAQREYLRTSGFRARSDTALAADLRDHDLDATLAALRAGEITTGHARVIATAAPKRHHKDEPELLDIARAHPADTCGRHTRAYENRETLAEAAAEAEAADAELHAQRADRRASLRRADDGMWELSGRFDYLTGRRLNQQFHAMLESLRQDADDEDRSYAQRAADALAELITGDGDHLRPRTHLLVIADYDVVAGQLADPRLDDGTPLPAALLAELATDAKVLPAVFDAKWANLALGTSRNASDMQRLVLAARDGGCIVCRAHSEQTHAHHIRYWSDGGPTEIPNLASLCPPCHKLVHERDWQVQVAADGHPKVQPPTHLRLPAGSPTVGDLLRTAEARAPDKARLTPST